MALTTAALILESNGVVYFRGNNVLLAGDEVGLTGQIPTSDGGGTNEGDYWVTPINDNDVVTGLRFDPYNVLSGLPAKPKPYSLAACKIRFQGVGVFVGKPDYWFVLGTTTQWAAASLPTSSSLVYWPTSQYAEPLTNSTTGIITSGSFKFTLGIPTLDGSPHLHFFPKGWYNGTALTAASGTGYTTLTALLVFLNASWATFGSPSITVTWTASPNNTSVIGTFTDTETDQLVVPSTHVLDAFVWAIT